MNDLEQDYEDIPMVEVIKTIKMLSSLQQDKKNIMQMASVLGVHLCKLQKEFGYPPVFPIDLIPLPKSQLKKWGFDYASLVVKKQGILKQFQQDAALYYTRFREISKSKWDAIKSNSVENIVLYNVELRDKKSSSEPIPSEFKAIIDSYRANYDNEVTELLASLKDHDSKSKGCLKTVLLFIAFTFILTFFILNN
jgi:hypothetical protein